jgi:adenosine deaminase
MSLESYIRALPKVELHVHLEGSIRPETLLKLAERNHVALPASDVADLQRWYTFVDFSPFYRNLSHHCDLP